MDNTSFDAIARSETLSAAKRQLLDRLTGGRRAGPECSRTEQRLKAIWSRALGTDAFGVDDNFFLVGGDSILGIRVRNLICEELGLALAVEQIYDRPTIRELAAAIESGRADAVVRSDGGAADRLIETAGTTDPAADVVDTYPMADMQKAMASSAELGRADGSYINFGDAAIDGPWSMIAFHAALDVAVGHHDVLRTSFDFHTTAEPMQHVHRPRRTPVPMVDITMVPNARDRALGKTRAAMMRHPFRLDDYPLLRVICVREGDRRHHIEHAHHHAILDGWSLNLLFRELWLEYERALRGIPAAAANIRTRYRDFVEVERAALASDETKTYWRSKLQSFPTSRFPVSASARAPGVSRVRVAIPSNVHAALTRVAGAEGAHLSTVLLAVHSACIGALYGTDRVLTGRVVNGRPESADGDRTLGLFVNSCLHTVDLRGATWLDLVRRTAAEERASQPHRRYPIARVPELVGQPRPIETLFVFEHYHMHAGAAPRTGLRVTGSDYATNDVKLVASFSWTPDRAEVHLTLYGLRGLVPNWLLRRTAGWYSRALRSLAADPAASIDTRSIFTAAEIHQQTIEWNDTARPLPERMLPDEIADRARAAPATPALVVGGHTHSYGEMNRAANRLANALLPRLVDADGPVAVLLPPGEEQTIAVIAIAKTGRAYVPLDVTYPVDRVRREIAEACAGIVVTTFETARRFGLDPNQVVPASVSGTLDRENDREPGIHIQRDGPLYVMFTSGSTGTPKAIRLNHLGRASNFHDFIDRFRIGRADRVLAVSNLMFDMSAFDIFGTLAAGGAVVVPTSEEKKDPRAWVRLIAAHGVTIWHSAPALARMLLDAAGDGPVDRLRTLRLVLLGGDWIPLDLASRLRRAAPGVDVISLGGATEVSMDSTIYRIGSRAVSTATVPYGRPMDNQTAWLLDSRLGLTPIGAVGELHLGGVGVGDGYVNRPELTAARFVPNPYPVSAGERVYRTGDCARFFGDGALELLGRRDFQVKINGFRIELGEIENTLLACAGVERAVVAARRGPDGQQRLVAYVVPGARGSDDALVAEIRRFAKSNLPSSHQPTRYILLDALPLTPNGKVNRLALPEPTREATASRAPVPPRTTLERHVFDAWGSVLRRADFGVDDDFFESGGDSVTATQIVSRLRATFGVDIPLALIFDNPTIALQAERLSALHDEVAS